MSKKFPENNNCDRAKYVVDWAWGNYVETLNDRTASQYDKDEAKLIYINAFNDWIQGGCAPPGTKPITGGRLRKRRSTKKKARARRHKSRKN
jgi:hypothetical protein